MTQRSVPTSRRALPWWTIGLLAILFPIGAYVVIWRSRMSTLARIIATLLLSAFIVLLMISNALSTTPR